MSSLRYSQANQIKNVVKEHNQCFSRYNIIWFYLFFTELLMLYRYYKQTSFACFVPGQSRGAAARVAQSRRGLLWLQSAEGSWAGRSAGWDYSYLSQVTVWLPRLFRAWVEPNSTLPRVTINMNGPESKAESDASDCLVLGVESGTHQQA